MPLDNGERARLALAALLLIIIAGCVCTFAQLKKADDAYRHKITGYAHQAD
jgi:hypothetical protein